jgi:hypothetical protein
MLPSSILFTVASFPLITTIETLKAHAAVKQCWHLKNFLRTFYDHNFGTSTLAQTALVSVFTCHKVNFKKRSSSIPGNVLSRLTSHLNLF